VLPSCFVPVAVAVAVAVAVTSYSGAALVPVLVMQYLGASSSGVLSWCQFCGVDQLSTLARV
jgi:hypothetical protein